MWLMPLTRPLPRLARLAGLTGLAATALVAVPVPSAVAEATDWCSSGASTPCIVSVTHDGSPVLKTDPTWQVDLRYPTPGDDVQWELRESGLYELTSAADGRWVVTLDMGTTVPRVNYGTGRNGQVTRINDGDGTYQVAVSAEPVLVTSGCIMSDPWFCPTIASSQAVRLGSQVSDWDQWTDPVQRAAFYGVDFWTNRRDHELPARCHLRRRHRHRGDAARPRRPSLRA